MGCGCKNAEGGCGCGTKEMNWESYDKPSFTKTMMARTRPMECDFCGGTDEVGYVDDDLTIKVCEHCDVDGSNPQIYSAEEVSDYNSFTNDMEALLAKYSQLLLSYETEYQDGIMEVFMRFKPYNAYFDVVDLDAESEDYGVEPRWM